MKDNTNNQNRDAVSDWEAEGGAGLSQAGRQVRPIRRARLLTGVALNERERVDASHDSDARGEHRYADAHQTGAEQKARHERDDLKRALAGRRLPGKGQ